MIPPGAGVPRFRLSSGAMTERLSCRTPGCDRTILPATAAKTGGICMPCVYRLAREEKEEFIRRNQVEIDPFAGVSDPVEILKIHYQSRPHNPLEKVLPYSEAIERVYLRLLPEQASRVVDHAVDLLRQGETESAGEILGRLAAFTEVSLDPALDLLITAGDFYPGFLFHRASPEIRDRLIQRIGRDRKNRNSILVALAWIGDQGVIDLFRRWRAKAPPWSDKLPLPLEAFLLEAGWELTEAGERRALFSSTCHALIPGEPQKGSPVSSAVPVASACPWCERDLTSLFLLDLSDERLRPVLGIGDRLQVMTCEVCTCFSTVFAQPVLGTEEILLSRPTPQAPSPDASEDWLRLPQDHLLLSHLRSPYHAVLWGIPEVHSQVGGHPTWIQDSEYPGCPACSQRMPFLAQLAVEDFNDPGEGIYYAFACPDCRTTATVYQQS